jgi:hypothetical protein
MNSFPAKNSCEDNRTKLSGTTAQTPSPAPLLPTGPEPVAPGTSTAVAPAAAAPLTPPPAPDPFLKIKIESLKRKQRADSFCHSVTPDQAYQIAAWMEEIDNLSEVHRRVSAPLPEGLGLKVNFSTLRRLRSAWRAEALTELSDSMFDVITDMEEGQTDFNHSARIQSAMSHLLHQKAFELAQTHPGSEVLKDVLTSIQKLSALEHKRQKIALEYEKIKRLAQPSLSPSQNTTRHHRVDLNIISSPSQPPAPLPNTRQSIEILAPLPEAVLEPNA